jgi:hypothetical protein
LTNESSFGCFFFAAAADLALRHLTQAPNAPVFQRWQKNNESGAPMSGIAGFT